MDSITKLTQISKTGFTDLL